VSLKKVQSKLRAAALEQRMLRIDRKPKYADRLYGFVVGVGAKWALLARIVDGHFDGYFAFRLRDVQRIRPDTTFMGTFAKSQPGWPPTSPFEYALDSTEDVLVALGQNSPLMGILKDNEHDAMWVGTYDDIIKKMVYIHEVRPDASWHDAPLGYKVKAITGVETGTRYMTALAAISGTEPPAPRG
tara:strand:- start:1546 stop:2103 length:558 start_codon:yes stop_codon:yes gene_type:complete